MVEISSVILTIFVRRLIDHRHLRNHLLEESAPMTSSNDILPFPSLDQIRECLQTISATLKDESYAVIGGAAMVAMGSKHRTTHDVDILVLTGKTLAIKNLLSASPGFILNPRTRHLTFSSSAFTGLESSIQIDVLTEVFANIPATELQNRFLTNPGIYIPAPSVLLNCKIATSYERSTFVKKQSDWSDVAFLIRWHQKNSLPLSLGSIPNATAEAYQDLVRFIPSVTLREWNFIGGLLPAPLQSTLVNSSVCHRLLKFGFANTSATGNYRPNISLQN